MVFAAVVAGCGSGADEPPSGTPEPVGEITAAIARPTGPDPLESTDRASQFVLRQVYEPLVAAIDPPFGRAGRRKGLALGFNPARNDKVWTVRLRQGIRFTDGTPLNAGAVAANARRWAAEERHLVPGLETADAPRPDRVRLILSDPLEELPELLAHSRLGIVSTQAFEDGPRKSVLFSAADAAGTGAFLVEARRAGRISLARNPGWWGSALLLGPTLRTIDFIVERDAGVRFGLLDSGEVEIADELGAAPRADKRELRADPLLVDVKGPRSLIGLERSVRGFDSGTLGTPLSAVWLSSVNQQSPSG